MGVFFARDLKYLNILLFILLIGGAKKCLSFPLYLPFFPSKTKSWTEFYRILPFYGEVWGVKLWLFGRKSHRLRGGKASKFWKERCAFPCFSSFCILGCGEARFFHKWVVSLLLFKKFTEDFFIFLLHFEKNCDIMKRN